MNENAEREGEDSPSDDTVVLKERRVRKIIRFRHFSKVREEDEYWREQLMLFVPWRIEEQELLDIDPKQKALNNMQTILNNSRPYYADRNLDENQIYEDMNQAEVDFVDPEERVNVEDQLLIDEEAADYTRQFLNQQQATSELQRFLPPKFVSDEEFNNLMYELNEKQRKFTLHCLHLYKTSNEPFYHILHGGAGVGKSKTIMAIVQCVLRYHQSFPSANPDCPPVLVTSFTGKAAFNVFGMTLSSAFRLPPLQNKKSHGNLDDGSANSLRAKIKDLRLLIVDEVSMVGVRIAYDVDKRLKQIMCNTKPFGGVSVPVVGHFRQLRPIGDSWIFNIPNHLKGGELGTLWNQFTMFELDEIMRQQGDADFCKGLNNMSEGVMDAEDITLFRSRKITESLQPPKDAIWLFRTNAECQEYNKKIHEGLQTDGFVSVASDRVEGADGNDFLRQQMLSFAKTLDVNQCDGLRHEVPLKVGAIYLISTNINVSDGLFNGADGTLMRIDYGRTGNNTRVPYRIWMQFKDPLVGSSKRAFTKDYQIANNIPINWVPIEKLTRHLSKANKENGKLIRSQFPLLAANAMTIAKSQRSTLSAVVVGIPLDKTIEREPLYVACSRATSRTGLFIHGTFKPPRKPAHNDVVTKELVRLRSKPVGFSLKFLQDMPSNTHKLYFHNVQSFTRHGHHLFKDPCSLAADVILLVETKLKEGDDLNCRPFQVVHRGNARRTGNSLNSEGGLLLSTESTGCRHIQTVVKTNMRGEREAHLTMIVCCVFQTTVIGIYKHPNFPENEFLRQLQELLSHFEGEPVIVIGDINTNLQEPEGRGVVSTFANFNLESKIPPNAKSTNFGTTIDVCFSNFNIDAWFYETYYSHHKAICVAWNH